MSVNSPDIERGFRPQLHYFVLLLAWFLIGATAALYCSFVKLDIWRPHVGWWIITTGLIVATVLIAGLLVIRRLWRRTHQGWAIGVFMLTVTPLVFFGCFIWLVLSLNQVRGDLRLSLPVRAFGIWVGDYFEIEASWQYPRLTEGEHVQLFDSGKLENPEQLTLQMDEFIQQLLQSLDAEPTRWKSAWVRGKLFGQTGRAVGLWAICSVDKDSEQLAWLDKHEVAHTVITSLCEIDQDPPMVLAEGWAVANSQPRTEVLQRLLSKRQQNSTWTLTELVSERHYGRSRGPAYHHGGPLVIYLLEQFGGKKFLQLYGTVRRPTFLSDAEQVLGVPWQKVDADFWIWLVDQKPQLLTAALASVDEESGTKSNESRTALSFASKQIEQRWKIVRAAALDHERQVRDALPDVFGFRLQREFSDRASSLKVLVTPQETISISEYSQSEFATSSYVAKRTDGTSFYYQTGSDRTEDEIEFDVGRDHPLISYTTQYSLSRLFLNQLRQQFYPDIMEPPPYFGSELTMEQLGPADDYRPYWRMVVRENSDGQPFSTTELLLDPEDGFNVLQATTRFKKEYQVTSFERGDFFGVDTCVQSSRRTIKGSESQVDNVPGEDKPDEPPTTERLSELSEQEIAEARQQFQDVESNLRNNGSVTWNQRLVNPYTIGFGWPLLALLILAIDMAGDRVKIRIEPNTSIAPDETS